MDGQHVAKGVAKALRTDYFAWLASTERPILTSGLYIPRSREKFGWRFFTVLHSVPPADTRSCALRDPAEYTKEIQGNISQCSSIVERPGPCDNTPGCIWRPIFQTGKCIPFHNVDIPLGHLTTTTTTALSAEPVGTVLIPINHVRVTDELVYQLIQDLKKAVKAATALPADEVDYVATDDLRIELTDEGVLNLLEAPTDEEKVSILNAIRETRCGVHGPDICDAQEAGATQGLMYEKASVERDRRLATVHAFNFTTFMILREGTDLSSTTHLWNPNFLQKCIATIPKYVNETANGDDTNNTMSLIFGMEKPSSKALTVIRVTIPDAAPIDHDVVQKRLTDTTRLADLITNVTGMADVIQGIPFVDFCAGRTCGGHGTCSSGVCHCDGPWAGINCLIPPPAMVTIAAANATNETNATTTITPMTPLLVLPLDNSQATASAASAGFILIVILFAIACCCACLFFGAKFHRRGRHPKDEKGNDVAPSDLERNDDVSPVVEPISEAYAVVAIPSGNSTEPRLPQNDEDEPPLPQFDGQEEDFQSSEPPATQQDEPPLPQFDGQEEDFQSWEPPATQQDPQFAEGLNEFTLECSSEEDLSEIAHTNAHSCMPAARFAPCDASRSPCNVGSRVTQVNESCLV